MICWTSCSSAIISVSLKKTSGSITMYMLGIFYSRHSAEKSSDIIFFEILPEHPKNLVDLVINVQDVAMDAFINPF